MLPAKADIIAMLKFMRVELEATQVELGRRFGVSQRTVSRWLDPDHVDEPSYEHCRTIIDEFFKLLRKITDKRA